MSPAAAGRRLLHRIGRRGGILVVVGIGWIGYGASIVVDPRYGTARGISVLTHFAPISAWGYGWVAAGVLSLTAGVWRRPRADNLGYVAAAVPPAVWSVAYLAAWLTGAYQPVWGSAIGWATDMGVILICSGWPEISRRVIRALRQRGDEHGG